MLKTASLAYPEKPATRLVQLSRNAETKICAALDVPRAGFLGILESASNSPGAKALFEFVRENVEVVEVGNWLEKGLEQYREAKITALQVPVPVIEKKK